MDFKLLNYLWLFFQEYFEHFKLILALEVNFRDVSNYWQLNFICFVQFNFEFLNSLSHFNCFIELILVRSYFLRSKLFHFNYFIGFYFQDFYFKFLDLLSLNSTIPINTICRQNQHYVSKNMFSCNLINEFWLLSKFNNFWSFNLEKLADYKSHKENFFDLKFYQLILFLILKRIAEFFRKLYRIFICIKDKDFQHFCPNQKYI